MTLLATGAADLVEYNLKNYVFDREQYQKRAHQGQELGVRQYELYREDIKDLIGLTVRKMDNYLLVNTLQLGFSFTILMDGRPRREEGAPPDEQSPAWLLGLYALCCAGAFLYYFLSIWLAMHASLAAHGFGARLLTQYVRLPVPTELELDEASANASQFEGKNVQELFRVPVLGKSIMDIGNMLSAPTRSEGRQAAGQDVLNEVQAESLAISGDVCQLPHLQIYRKLQGHWQCHDAYARVCMALGTNQVLHALVYEALILLMVEHAVWYPAIAFTVTMITTAWVIARIDLQVKPATTTLIGFLMVAPPLLVVACLRTRCKEDHLLSPSIQEAAERIVVPVVYVLHAIWIIFSTELAKATTVGTSKLPMNFRSIHDLDVFKSLQSLATQRPRSTTVDDGAPVEAPVSVAASLQERELLWVEAQQLSEDIGHFDRMLTMVEDDPAAQDRVRRCRDDCAVLVADFKQLLKLPEADAAPAPPEADAAPAPRRDVWLEYEPSHGEKTWWDCQAEHMTTQRPLGRPETVVRSLSSLEKELGMKLDVRGKLAGAGSSPTAQQRQPQQRLEADPRTRELAWDTVNKGGQALVFGWMTSIVWVVGHMWFGVIFIVPDDSYPRQPERNATLYMPSSRLAAVDAGLGGDSEWASSGIWPSSLLHPEGVACHEALGPVALVSGKYSVHVLPLSRGGGGGETGTTALQATIDACLRRAPGLQSKGLLSISVGCAGERGAQRCSAVLLGSDGMRALKCDLCVPSASPGSVPCEAQAAAGKALHLRGGPWRAVALGGGADGLSLWAARGGKDNSLVELRPRRAESGELWPYFDLMPPGDEDEMPSDISALHATADAVLALSQDGRVRMWPLRGGAPQQWRWSYKVETTQKWSGICAADGALFLLGARVSEDGGSTPAPRELRRAELPWAA